MAFAPRKIAANLALVLVSLLLPLLALEAWLAATGYDPLRGLRNGREVFIQPSADPDIKYEWIPGSHGRAWQTDIQINAQGFRGPPATPGKFDGTRIIAIGDSVTFGNFAPADGNYPYLLGQMLADTPVRHEVLNFGVGGYDTVQEAALLQEKGLAFKPDIVVLGFCLNDLGVASFNLEYIERLKQYQSHWIFRFRSARFIANLVDTIILKRWTEQENDPRSFARHYGHEIDPISPDETALRELMAHAKPEHPSIWFSSELRVGRMRHAFARLEKMAAENHFRVVVVIVPWMTEENGRYPYPEAHRIVAMEAQRAHFDVIDVTDDFMKAGMVALRTSEPDAVHPNAEGHRIIAEHLAAYIRKQEASRQTAP